MTTAVAVVWRSNGVSNHAFPAKKWRAPSLCGKAWKPQVARPGGATCVDCERAAR